MPRYFICEGSLSVVFVQVDIFYFFFITLYCSKNVELTIEYEVFFVILIDPVN